MAKLWGLLLILRFAFAAETKPKLRGFDAAGAAETQTKTSGDKKIFPSPKTGPSAAEGDTKDAEPPKASGKPAPPRPGTKPTSGPGPANPAITTPELPADFGPPDLDDPVRALTCAKIGNEPWHEAGEPAHDCEWLAAALIRNPSLCALQNDDGVHAYERCKITCRVCGRTCDDSPDFRTVDAPNVDSLGNPVDFVGDVGGGGRDCAWVGKNAKERCGATGKIEGNGAFFAYEACRLACKTCDRRMEAWCLDEYEQCDEEPICLDVPLWGPVRDEPGSNCLWVAENPHARCGEKDVAGVLAFDACRATCGVCGARCDDDPSWHKRANENKDCRWVGRDRDRCDKEGEDRTMAWESCRFACSSCDRAKERKCMSESCLKENGRNLYHRAPFYEYGPDVRLNL